MRAPRAVPLPEPVVRYDDVDEPLRELSLLKGALARLCRRPLVPGQQAPLLIRPGEINGLLTAVVKRRFQNCPCLEVLDAGCGRMWTWDLGGVPMRLTGVDNDAEALRLRVEHQRDLDEYIAGDLREVRLNEQWYDVVHSAFVLEHVRGAVEVLDKFARALKPGGLLVLRIPDRDSVYAYLARVTPLRLHVAYKRVIRGRKLAGTPGHGPYPVVYDDVVSWRGINEWAQSRRLTLVAAYADNSHLQFFGKAAPIVDLLLHLLAALSLGRLTARHANVVVVFERPAAAQV